MALQLKSKYVPDIKFELDKSIENYDRAISTNRLPETVGKWCNWVFVKNQLTSKLSIYLNGRLLISSTGRHSFKSPVPFDFGRDFSGREIWDYYPGSLDDIYIYKRALKASEVQSLFQLGLTPL